MKTLLNPWFLLGCMVWLITFVLRKLHYTVPYLNGHLTDVFAIPVIATLGLWFQRHIILKNVKYALSYGYIVFVVVYVSIVFELILPHYSSRYTSDWTDVLLYIVGGLFFYKVMNKPI